MIPLTKVRILPSEPRNIGKSGIQGFRRVLVCALRPPRLVHLWYSRPGGAGGEVSGTLRRRATADAPAGRVKFFMSGAKFSSDFVTSSSWRSRFSRDLRVRSLAEVMGVWAQTYSSAHRARRSSRSSLTRRRVECCRPKPSNTSSFSNVANVTLVISRRAKCARRDEATRPLRLELPARHRPSSLRADIDARVRRARRERAPSRTERRRQEHPRQEPRAARARDGKVRLLLQRQRRACRSTQARVTSGRRATHQALHVPAAFVSVEA